MGRKAKVPAEIKLRVVKNYLEGRVNKTQIARQLEVNISSIEGWIRKYKTYGPKGLITNNKNNYYSEDIKSKAITDYINKQGSLAELCIKYNITSKEVLRRWINMYNNSHKICKSQNNKGVKIMTNGRKTTYEERVEIVSFCIANANDYNLTANKYKVSYQQVYTWVKKYSKSGYNALVDRRGKHKNIEELSESERIAAQLKLLEAENRRLKMENDFLKKLEEIERR